MSINLTLEDQGDLGIEEEDNHSRRLESPNVPDLKKNLVSISTMEDKGYKVTFSDGKLSVWKNNVKEPLLLGFELILYIRSVEVH